MNILILDDDPNRHEGFIQILNGHNLFHVWTYRQAIKAFRNEKFDMACLDHDLGEHSIHGEDVNVDSQHFHLTYSPDFHNDGMYDGSRIYLDGADVCVWLRDNPQFCPKKVLIHSWNVVGAETMHNILNQIPGIAITRKAFSR